MPAAAPTPDALEPQFTLRTATARFDELRGRDDDPSSEPGDPVAARVRDEALERLALAEVIARKAAYGRQLDVQAARVAGAPWAAIGAALGVSKQAAWEAHNRWIDDQVAHHDATGYEGFGPDDEAVARAVAGRP
jgi:hypothetical protein